MSAISIKLREFKGHNVQHNPIREGKPVTGVWPGEYGRMHAPKPRDNLTLGKGVTPRPQTAPAQRPTTAPSQIKHAQQRAQESMRTGRPVTASGGRPPVQRDVWGVPIQKYPAKSTYEASYDRRWAFGHPPELREMMMSMKPPPPTLQSYMWKALSSPMEFKTTNPDIDRRLYRRPETAPSDVPTRKDIFGNRMRFETTYGSAYNQPFKFSWR
ncbi:hypothetical protein Bbelb_009690 [Branchiostoma belcheri]|nr:hypothetical protein Bbelb_009690 [Branchiostoma belcheri]